MDTYPEEGDLLRKSIKQVRTIKEQVIKQTDLGISIGKPIWKPRQDEKWEAAREKREKKKARVYIFRIY